MPLMRLVRHEGGIHVVPPGAEPERRAGSAGHRNALGTQKHQGARPGPRRPPAKPRISDPQVGRPPWFRQLLRTIT
jgi:hypothetical protein